MAFLDEKQINKLPDRGFLYLTACWNTMQEAFWWNADCPGLGNHNLAWSCFLTRSREILQTWGPTFIPLEILSILAKKTEEIGPILRKIELYAYRDLVFSRDLARFHKSEVLRFFPLRFWGFWRKNGGNRTNIKEDIAICLSRSCILERSREIS